MPTRSRPWTGLAVESDRPGNETVRTELGARAGLLSGAGLAALGQQRKSLPQLQTFLVSTQCFPRPVGVSAPSPGGSRGSPQGHEFRSSRAGLVGVSGRHVQGLQVAGRGSARRCRGGLGRRRRPVSADCPSSVAIISALSNPVSRSEFITDFWKGPRSEGRDFRERGAPRVRAAGRLCGPSVRPGRDSGQPDGSRNGLHMLGARPTSAGRQSGPETTSMTLGNVDVQRAGHRNALRGTPGGRNPRSFTTT